MIDKLKEEEIFQTFQHKTASVSARLERIAEITMSMAEVNIADSNNPNFIVIMQNHKKLIAYMEQLIIEYDKYQKKPN